MLKVTLLAILQGVAEFLPISSSGHLVLGKSVLGLSEAGIRLDIFLHVGTLVAVFVFYAGIIGRLLRGAFTRGGDLSPRAAWSYALKVVLSAIPIGLVGVCFGDAIESAFAAPRLVGYALIGTGIILSLTRFLSTGQANITFARALAMGLAQAVAILPGVSRSGMTLAAARATKMAPEASAEFSFLMSAPPIAGAAILEVIKSLKAPTGLDAAAETPWAICAFGAVLAAVVGYFSLKLLVRSLKGRWFWLFGPYCVLAGLATVFRADAFRF